MAMAAKTLSKRWLLPVVWKFCELDKSHDRLTSFYFSLDISFTILVKHDFFSKSSDCYNYVHGVSQIE